MIHLYFHICLLGNFTSDFIPRVEKSISNAKALVWLTLHYEF